MIFFQDGVIGHTKTTASRAAQAKTSAQDTTPGQEASSWDFASSITSKPLKPVFAKAFFSAEDLDINMDPSHPCYELSNTH